MEVPRPGVESELQLQSTPQLWQCWIFLPTVLGWGSNLHLPSDLSHCSWTLNPLPHSRISGFYILNGWKKIKRIIFGDMNIT